ncbi:ferric reductase family protein [Phanerochaete sordida]|uniref:ferric-chelate reductase (NADPH) n=1 Tax=Phanerochaete sordida TaxID=48140 RepID=A0A9P3GLH3_9APHY|nr:ferric reductase family protein [Phanerochaete sordida]
MWHSSRVPSGYDYTKMTAEQIKLIGERWHDWYTADWDYGLTTVEFLCACVGAMTLLHLASTYRARASFKSTASTRHRAGPLDRLTAGFRFVTSKQWRVQSLGYYAPPTGSIIGISCIFTFVMALALAARPFYWPNYQMGHSPPLATRSGWISIAIMPFMIAFATKVNFVGLLTGVSHERLQAFHRWTALFMYITSLLHTFPFIVTNIDMGDMVVMYKTSPFYWSGIVALIPQTWLVFMSWGIIRSRYYEVFKKLHFIATGIFMVALFIHCDFRLTSWDYFWAALAIYCTAWLIQLFRTLYNSAFGLPYTLEQLSDPHLVQLTIAAPARFRWAPGQHVFVRILAAPSLLPFSTHPFTIANVPAEARGDTHDVQLVFRVRRGLTKALQELALSSPRGRLFLDGPYGGLPVSLRGYDRVYLLASGSGATFTVPLLIDLARGFGTGSKCTQATFVVALRHSGARRWFEPALADATARAAAAGVDFAAQIHITSDGSDLESVASADSALEKAGGSDAIDDERATQLGRPHLATLVREACASQRGGRIAFAVCGPAAFMYDVRNAVAEGQREILDGCSPCEEIFLHAEAYDW